jgi:hypothetical protein
VHASSLVRKGFKRSGILPGQRISAVELDEMVDDLLVGCSSPFREEKS